ncbi:ATP-dependent Lon protease [Caldanaerobius fijiensis DSM 17918]|uniref:Lon protease n=1 Tax=Caldanaerobius fijiensis DSM 17918 TaxID=1121256 RepID=A0A1M4SV71_9THEO|nr:endopeptidase La [Caldanaerobius fijiensis]SHE36109.1 ATP-dependent Lon protease [Caldanaerobius fijiensis DSM 17918]
MEEIDVKIKTMPLIPLRGLTVYPYMIVHFDVGRKKSIFAIEEAMANDQMVFLVTQKNLDDEDPSIDGLYRVGTIAKIKQILKLPGEVVRVLVEGISRGEILSVLQDEPFVEVNIKEHLDEPLEKSKEITALMRGVANAFEEYIGYINNISPEILISVISIEEPGRLADVIASHVSLNTSQKQEILEIFDVRERLERLYGMLLNELDIMEIEREITAKVRKKIDKVQKDYYLREQLNAIREELGEADDVQQEINEYKEKIEKANLPDEAREKALKELDRLSKMAPGAPESSVIRTYLDWILDLPWNTFTEDKLDIEEARRILDEDHYGLEKVKERILEYLAVRKLKNDVKGSILCLVGPPGVGKTSLGRSIARAMGRKFVRISLGGLRDEAEIRGHRRTYIGAMPGKIISSLKYVKTSNPVFLFDEIDKMSSDFRGDPASAMLEVLDPEQNVSFRDNYLDIPFDLSKVFFITTANATDTIPQPLLDRMEVIYISGYTDEEKLNIAKKYLWPKQLKEHGIQKPIAISDKAIKKVIEEYTREAGVRNLERNLAALVRKIAKNMVERENFRVTVSTRIVESYLGKPLYRHEKPEEKNEVGVVTGLAWTPMGGEILSVEAIKVPGSGKLVLTGQLGDVMKESAQAGFTYIRSKAKELGIDDQFYKDYDIHIHVPEGAIPKDGPSAGITMATAMVSALTGRPADRNIAMTGEITLVGKVLPIGGVKEKVLAAYRAGIKKVILPADNRRDIDDIPQSIRRKIEFIFVNTLDQVLDNALNK